MKKVPFQRELEDLFASDKSIILKLLGGAFVGAVLSLKLAMKDPKHGGLELPNSIKGMIVIGGGLVGLVVVLLLSLRDVVARRAERGQRVNPLLRAYFGRGNGCLMLALWSATVIVVTFIVTVTLLALMV